VYLVHLISIDLELSRSFNSPTLHCYSYESGLHYLLNQSIYYLIYEVTTSTTFASVLSFFTYQMNGRLHLTDKRTQQMNEPTNQIKSLERQNKVSPRR